MFSKQPTPPWRTAQRPAGAARTVAALAIAALVATLPPAAATAAEGGTPFSGKRFVYRADGKKLAEVLQDFAASQGVPVVIDPGVDGSVNGNFNAHAQDFLDSVARSYGVIWYFDGVTLFIYPSRAMQSKVFRMRGYDRTQVHQMLRSLGLGDARFPLRFDDVNQTLLAYGPPRHIELVSTLVEQLERGNRDRIGTSIQVVPLHFATAADRTIGNARIPGLASTLNNLFAASGEHPDGDGSPQPAGGPAIADKLRAVQSTYGLKMQPAAPTSSNSGKRDDPARAERLESARPVESFDAERPYFQAEQTTNAIIVRGLPDRMHEYETLIRQLDISQDLVEIEASIIDVSSDDFDSLGIDWNFSKDGTTRFSLTPGSPATTAGGSTSDSLTGNITTLVGGAGAQLLTHIRALEGKGKAHILARPKVLGVVNRVATMTDKRVASVRVSGNLDANLYSVEAGTTLSVTPQIVAYPDHREVRLSLSIQDGDFEDSSVDQVPVVKQTQIDTEAVVREGESLLIGGISVESSLDGSTGVPLLSHIPLLGAAFRHSEASKSRTERLFLLTPKIVALGVARTTPAAAAPPVPAPQAPKPLPAPVPTPAPVPAPTPTPTTVQPQRTSLAQRLAIDTNAAPTHCAADEPDLSRACILERNGR